jgi:hypothetical protein
MRAAAERGRLKKKQPGPARRDVPGVAIMKWYDPSAEDNPPYLKAAAEARKMGVRENWCYHHAWAIMLSIDQYAEAATGNRECFWNKPHRIRK